MDPTSAFQSRRFWQSPSPSPKSGRSKRDAFPASLPPSLEERRFQTRQILCHPGAGPHGGHAQDPATPVLALRPFGIFTIWGIFAGMAFGHALSDCYDTGGCGTSSARPHQGRGPITMSGPRSEPQSVLQADSATRDGPWSSPSGSGARWPRRGQVSARRSSSCCGPSASPFLGRPTSRRTATRSPTPTPGRVRTAESRTIAAEPLPSYQIFSGAAARTLPSRPPPL